VVFGPLQYWRIEQGGCNQVRVGQAEAEVVEVAGFDHGADFAWLRHAGMREKVEQRERLGSLLHGARGQVQQP